MESIPSSPFGVLGDRQSLSLTACAEIVPLSGPRPQPFLLTALYAWAVITCVIWWVVEAQSVWATPFAIVIVATRQNVLGLLVHGQADCLGFLARPGDLIANLLASYPLLIATVEGYVQMHLSHHKYLFTKKYPDFLRKSGPEWTFPTAGRRLGKRLFTDLFGLTVWRLFKGKDYRTKRSSGRAPPQNGCIGDSMLPGRHIDHDPCLGCPCCTGSSPS